MGCRLPELLESLVVAGTSAAAAVMAGLAWWVLEGLRGRWARRQWPDEE